jgi:hypothetical protein
MRLARGAGSGRSSLRPAVCLRIRPGGPLWPPARLRFFRPRLLRAGRRLGVPAPPQGNGISPPRDAPTMGLPATFCLHATHAPRSAVARPASRLKSVPPRAGSFGGITGRHPRTPSRRGEKSRLLLAAKFCHARHGVLASFRSSIPSFGLPPREEQPGSSLGGLGRGWACRHGPARGVRPDNRARKPRQGAPGRMAT